MIALLLLSGAAGFRLASAKRSGGVEALHRHIRTVAAEVPRRIAAWVGNDVPLPAQALTTLRPNVTISRHFVNVENGVAAGFLLVHCSDAHDMAGHFPLRCYPAEDWTLDTAASRDWKIGTLVLTGTEYRFAKDAIRGGGVPQTVIVANFLLRPGGLILRDMDGLSRSMVGAGSETTGAGQIQLYFDGSVSLEHRDEAVKTLVGGHLAMIEAMLAPDGQTSKQAVHAQINTAGRPQ